MATHIHSPAGLPVAVCARTPLSAWRHTSIIKILRKTMENLKRCYLPRGMKIQGPSPLLTNRLSPDKVQNKNAWMIENSVGEWFCKPGTYYSTGMVIHQMIEAFSHGGNYTINFPISPEGELDQGGVRTLKEIGKWMKINGEAVYRSRAWKVIGEGNTKMPNGNLSEAQDVPFTPKDIRFTTHNGNLYAFVMSVPANKKIVIRSLATGSRHAFRRIQSITLLGETENMRWKQTPEGLEIIYAKAQPSKYAFVLKIVPEYR